ncbi:flavin reductase family protein [Selenihalanaerobacter shriftii]|uniref:NADH-FMN oxidoreductase RutF, flavin reductase (DIM6/NTAB) family n=1 Tax=Selenihalanaerobacter shriftii TaxID=142842 RepID=A0A1T4MMD8_9FIRM|nr:flavin reductase family protein [Selenihalanaerobacter shriftii]SJZ68239.1 NADH-FMN oxidoreductase RutF, flavin reductase (DIM6/NTAB) family [Selenihalanaerobacter shriftii]
MKNKYPIERIKEIFPYFPVVLATIGNNIITLDFVQFFSFNPPIIGIGICPDNYSHELIKERKEFVVNIPTVELVNEVKFCGNNSGKNFDKFLETGLTSKRAEKVNGQLIAECPVNIECKVIKEDRIGNCDWFFGEVKEVHVAKNYKSTHALLYSNNEYQKLK